VIGLAVLHLPSVRGRVLERARAYAEREFGVALRASSLGYNLLTRSIELRGLSVASTSASDPFLEADRAAVELGPGIFRGRVTVNRVSLDRPRLTLVRYADGTVNLPPSQDSTEKPAPLQLGIVSVTALSARLDDRAAQRSFALGPFDLALDTAAASSRPGVFGPGEFTARAGEIELSGTLAGRLGFDGSRVRIEELTADTNEGRVVLGGWADIIGDEPAVSAHATATVNILQAARLAGVDVRGLSGYLDGTIEAAGALAAPSLSLAVTGRDVAAAQLGRLRLTGRSSFSGTRALIDTLDVDGAAGSLHAEGVIELGEPQPRSTEPASHVALRWSNLRLDDLAQVFDQSLAIRTGSLASGTAAVDFETRDLEARAWSRLRAAATATFQPGANASSDEALLLSGRADLQLEQGRWSLRHSIDARSVHTDLTGNVSGSLLDGAGDLRSTLGGSSRLRVRDIAAVPPLMQTIGVKLPPEAVDDVRGSMIATVELAGTLGRPRAEVDLEARELRARVWPDATDLDAQFTVDADAVRAQSVRATTGTTSVQASGRYAWRGPFDARVELREQDLAGLARRFELPVTVSGSAQLEGAISGTLSSVARRGQGVLTLSARDLAVDEVAIGLLSANGKVTLDDEGLTIVDATAPGVGASAHVEIVNRSGYPVSGEVTIDHDDIGTLVPPRYREQVGDVSGRLSATARGSGLLTDPAAIRGRIDLRELDVTARGTRLALAAPGSVTLAEDRIAIGGIDLRFGQQTRATLSGQLGVTALPDALRLHLDGPLSELIDIGVRTGGSEPVPLQGDGTATLDLAIRGTFAHPQPDGSIAVRSPSLAYGTLPAVTGLALDATIDPTLITLGSVAARWQGASLSAGGTVPWRVVLSSIMAPPEPGSPPSSRLAEWLNALPTEPARARVTIRARNVTEAALKEFVTPEQLANVQLGASATIAVEADRLSLEQVQATAVLDDAWLTLAGVPFVQDVPTRFSLANGRAAVDDFRWSAEGNSIVATGSAGLTQSPPTIELGVTGVLDLRVLSAFVAGVGAGGTARANLTAAGQLDNPEIVGDLTVADGVLQLDSPRLAASDLAGTLRIGTGRKVAVSLAGLVNTGTARLTGTIDLADLASPLGTLQLTARGVALDYPPGLQTESNAVIELALGAASSTLNGRIDVLGGTYREALVLSSQLLRLSSTSGIARTAPPADWLSRLRLDVAVATASDLRVDNNYGRLDVGLAVRLVGTAANPGVLGQLQAAEDGEIYLGGNTYRIERLVIDLNNPRTITPEVNFSAQTRIGDVSIGIEFRCPATGPCERKVTSLTTGVDDKVAEARLFGTEGGAASAGEGLARLLSGEILGVVGRTVGLDAIRLEQQAQSGDIFDDPTLISGDVDPAARLTLAKRLGSNVELVFSQNLADEGFTWVTSYFGPYGLSWRLLVLDDQSRSYEFRHEPPIGAGRTRRRQQASGPRIDAVRIAGAPGFPERDLRRQLRLTEGDRFTFAAWQRDRDRLERFYHDQGLVEARIRARRLSADAAGGQVPPQTGQPSDAKVVLEYAITRGPATQLIIRGTTLPDAVRDRIVERWTSALFDGFLERDARTIARDHLFREGYLDARVTAAVAMDAARETKTLTIEVVPGSIVSPAIEIAGNAALPTAQLLDLIRMTDALAAWLDPPSVERLLENLYRAEGFLAADVSVGRPESRNGTSVVTIQVVEGAPYSIGEVGVSGLPNEPGLTAGEALTLTTGDRYRPASVAGNVDRIEAGLRRAAYREARIAVDTRVNANTARVDVAMVVTPGPRSILRDVVVQGGDASKPSVARSIVLTPDAPLDPEAIGETRKRLYDLDVYRSVDIDVQPAATTAPPPSTGAPADQPVVATITLGERPRYRIRYGLAVSDEIAGADERDRRLGVAADLENRNVFGRNMSAGLSVRLRRNQQVGRVTLGANRLFGLPIRSTLFVEREREQINPEGASPFTSDVNSLTAEQAYRVRRGAEIRYGYGLERNHTFIRTEGPGDSFDLTVKIARLTTSGLVDRRDDPFNPRRGWFAASTLELSTPGLGSDLRFLKDFAQYSHFVPVGRGVVVASAARLGLARTFEDEVLIPSERFFGGGANTVRGYREDDLGARSIFDDAEGGSALLVLNGELRFPVYRWLKGVGFVDLGNVYPTVSDLSFADLQIGIGAGARFDTPFGLFRLDLGVPANRRSFDPSWRIHFGLGHAF